MRSIRRRGFTLIELMVVMALIVVIAALGYALVPGLLGNYNRVGAVDQVSQWLLTAKQRAKRDQVPTGVRLLPQVDGAGNLVINPDGTVFAKTVQYIQQPDVFTGGFCQGVTNGAATFMGVDFLGGAPPPPATEEV